MSKLQGFEHKNLPDQLADHIVMLIADKQLEPGQRLFEKDVCTLLGVSRIPVREALRLLQAQGVVQTVPNRGTFISEFSTKETMEMLEVRVTIEKIAIRRVVANPQRVPELIEALEESIAGMERAAKLDDALASCIADLQFHNRIVEFADNPLLLPLWQSLSRSVLIFLRQERTNDFDYQAGLEDHRRLIELIRQGKRAPLDREIEQHITGYLPLNKVGKARH